MPDVPIKPPNKRVDSLTTELTLEVHRLFKDEKDLVKRNNEIITYLIKQLAVTKAILEVYEQ